ncbi:response regulator transcription factor [Sediminibacterium soli]|uniref:response regulator transcription factor n=1 Tax=Sediminibacterium soli TaxID=2698829 RepID=UPI00137B74F9|nr:response regulator transcription factor [Sediminibacterium soli]NCI47822.1 response regulator transcription factor [Sediminibacterium soli]
MKTTIGIIDDHILFAKSLGLMLRSFRDYEVVIEAGNGKDLQEKLTAGKPVPDIMLIDVNMPVMNGIDTARWLSAHHPGVKLVALSMNDEENIIIDMLKAGCCAYMLKETHPDELEKALEEIAVRGYYNPDSNNIHFRRLPEAEKNPLPPINEREKRFLQHACSDLTYREIASLMHLSERTIDGYRESLFGKLNVQSRVGLALEAIRKGLVTL